MSEKSAQGLSRFAESLSGSKGDVLAAEGFQVLDLGADLPTDDLLHAIATHEPAVLCLSATMPASAGLVTEPGAFVDDAESAAD